MLQQAADTAEYARKTLKATKKTLAVNRTAGILELRPYLAFEMENWGINKAGSSYSVGMAIRIINNGSTPAKDFVSIEVDSCSLTPADGVVERHDFHATYTPDPPVQPNFLHARYISPNGSVVRGLTARLKIPAGSEIVYDNLHRALNMDVRKRQHSNWRVKYLQVCCTVRFKDDFKIQSNEH